MTCVPACKGAPCIGSQKILGPVLTGGSGGVSDHDCRGGLQTPVPFRGLRSLCRQEAVAASQSESLALWLSSPPVQLLQ